MQTCDLANLSWTAPCRCAVTARLLFHQCPPGIDMAISPLCRSVDLRCFESLQAGSHPPPRPLQQRHHCDLLCGHTTLRCIALLLMLVLACDCLRTGSAQGKPAPILAAGQESGTADFEFPVMSACVRGTSERGSQIREKRRCPRTGLIEHRAYFHVMEARNGQAPLCDVRWRVRDVFKHPCGTT